MLTFLETKLTKIISKLIAEQFFFCIEQDQMNAFFTKAKFQCDNLFAVLMLVEKKKYASQIVTLMKMQNKMYFVLGKSIHFRLNTG